MKKCSGMDIINGDAPVKGVNMIEVKRRIIPDGHDCWGNREYVEVYTVTDENGKILYSSKEDPTKLINGLGIKCEVMNEAAND